MKKNFVKEEIIYREEYFYSMGYWWILRRENNFVGCSKVSQDEVPPKYLTT